APSVSHAQQPDAIRLKPMYPNPFNPTTLVEFELPRPSRLRLVIYNALGQQVRVLAAGQFREGIHRLRWDGTDQFGNQLPTGMYFIRLSTKTGIQRTRSVLLLR
ncbi:MAG: T9SS C-terminal target domain-containing protein, partial [Calditrichaeota bacterium]